MLYSKEISFHDWIPVSPSGFDLPLWSITWVNQTGFLHVQRPVSYVKSHFMKASYFGSCYIIMWVVSSIYFALLVDIQAKLAIVLPGPNFNFFLVITAAISFSTNLLVRVINWEMSFIFKSIFTLVLHQ